MQGVAAAVLVGIDVVVDAVDVEGRVLDAVRIPTWFQLAPGSKLATRTGKHTRNTAQMRM